MSRQEDIVPPGAYERPQPPMAAPAPQAPAPQTHRGQPNAIHAEYAKRPPAPAPRAPQPQLPLDQHGRVAPQPRSAEEDHLEIPAFLRRQSS
jgi:cell division protein FtsZ